MMYIITHKEFKVPEKANEFSVLQVGAAQGNDLGVLRDDTGDNISEYNPFFCELTGMYWLWKNVSEKYVGICHYRRFFSKKKEILNLDELNQYMQGYDLIIPRLDKFAISVYKQYGYSEQHNISDFDCMAQIIKEKYSDYYAEFERMTNEPYFYPFNMMYMKKELFDLYCSWLFGILFELEKKIPYKDYVGQKKRVFGYLSERLLLVWVRKNNLKVKELDVLNTESNVKIIDKIFTRINTYSTVYLGIDLRKQKK